MTTVAEAQKMAGPTLPVLDKGFIRLDAYEASDLSVVNAARVSFAKHKSAIEEEDVGLIRFLMKGRHTSPFEHGYFRFHVKVPIMVVREWHRHRTWSFNEWSGRYSVLQPEWYVPARDDIRHQVGKPGAYTFERVEEDGLARWVQDKVNRSCEEAFEAYELMLQRGIAKEQARLVLPVNTYTEMYASVDPLNLMRFLSLRNTEHAMFEIREYAKAMEELVKPIIPVTMEAFIAQGRML